MALRLKAVLGDFRAVLQQLAEDESWAVGWVFDGRKNIYAPLEIKGKGRQRFIGQDEHSYEVTSAAVVCCC